jgi:type II secretory pathway predicted ATPase ExeA
VYEAHFGLADLPFHIAPDPRFYVDAAPHRAALDALLGGLERGDEFMLLTGDFGSGKTTVARRLAELVDHDEVAVGELSGLRIEGDDLLNRIAESLGERSLDADHRLGALLGLLERFGNDKRQALLIIDEAHGVGLDALRRLKKLTAVRAGGRGVLHVCFVGRAAPPGLEDLERLGRPLVIGTTLRLGPLDASATRGYILHRLSVAGWTGRPAFDRDATDEIHRLCEGNPGRINRLCAHILLQLYMNGRDDTSPAVVRAVDELMKSELEGEGLPVDLPPPASASREPDTVLEPRSQLEDEEDEEAAGLEIEGLSTHSFGQTLPAVRAPLHVGPSRPWTGTAPAGSRGAQRVLQAAFAVLLMVGGGVVWQAIGGRTTVNPDAARHVAAGAMPAAPGLPASTVAAGLAAAAEQAIAQQPTAAGHLSAAAAPAGAHAAPPSATQAAPRRVAEVARDGPVVADRGHRRGRARAPDAEPAATPEADAAAVPADVRARAAAQAAPVLPLACSATAETMGLCARASQPQARPQPKAPAEATVAAPVSPQAIAEPAPQAAPPPATEPAPAPRAHPACDPTRTALGLCPD